MRIKLLVLRNIKVLLRAVADARSECIILWHFLLVNLCFLLERVGSLMGRAFLFLLLALDRDFPINDEGWISFKRFGLRHLKASFINCVLSNDDV